MLNSDSPGRPPAAPMTEPDRQTAERHRGIWERFRRRPEVSPWTGRVDLPPEVTATVGFVIPVEDEEVCRRLREAVARLEATGAVIAFPPEYWHITVVPPALLTSDDPAPPRLLPMSMVEQALEKARRAVRGQAPFDVVLRGLNAFRDVIVAVPYDGGRGQELGRILRSAVPELPDTYTNGHQPIPHVSLTQWTREDRLHEVVELLQDERDTDFGTFRAHRLEMFVLPWRDGVPGRVTKHPLPLD